MKKRILFIINPISGVGKHKTVEKYVKADLNKKLFDYHFEYTKYPHHATEIAHAHAHHYDIIAAVGGDGTINEVASALIDKPTIMAIIPAGSGNGLARHLDIPLKINKAIQAINDSKTIKIDSIKVGDRYSVNVSGVGFDAFISHLFAKSKRRGPLSYIQLITREFPLYKSNAYTLEIDDEFISTDAFLISFANSSQYGNNLQIAPNAMIDDGYIDVCIIKDFPKYTAPALLLSLFDTTIDRSRFDIIKKAKRIVIHCETPFMGHIDGEPAAFSPNIEIAIHPLSLNVLVPSEEFKNQSLITDFKTFIPSLPNLISN